MNKKRQSIDGFVPRRSGAEVGEQRLRRFGDDVPVERKELRSEADMENESIGEYRPDRSIARADIDDSLNGIVDEPEPKKLSRRERRRQRKVAKIAPNKKKRIIKLVIIAITVILLTIAGFFAYKFIRATGNVFGGNIFGIFQNEPLKEDANGRSNFLLLGTTDDDPNHPGNTLTDTIMILSVDQDNKNAYMFSVPRDLYVDYGMACPAGYQGKINSYFSCVNSGSKPADEQDRLTKTQKFIGGIYGIDIQYGVHVNSVVLRDAVDAVGGVDVDIQGSGGAPGILDRNFDWGCNYTCYKVKYNNGVHHLNGEQAMYLAMARGDTAPTYGLGRSNFDREQNQQKILQGLKVKATSTGFLANPSAVTKLIDSVGDNLRTNVQTNEIRTIMDIANKMQSEDIHSVDFMDQTPAIFTTGNMGAAGSVVYPLDGVGDYTGLRAFVKRQLSANPVVRENASVLVLNGTSTAGLAKSASDELKAAGFNVAGYDDADKDTYNTTVVYQMHKNLSATKEKLASKYGVEVTSKKPPFSVNDTVDFVVILGKDRTSTSQ